MSSDQKLDSQIQLNQNKISQLSIQMDHIEREEQELREVLGQLNLTQEQLIAYTENQNNFTSKSWEEMQQHKKALEDKLKLQLTSIKDPRKTKRARSSLHVERHWLHVR